MNENFDTSTAFVALLAEGVDRNYTLDVGNRVNQVALLAEGVDRNKIIKASDGTVLGRPPRGGRG